MVIYLTLIAITLLLLFVVFRKPNRKPSRGERRPHGTSRVLRPESISDQPADAAPTPADPDLNPGQAEITDVLKSVQALEQQAIDSRKVQTLRTHLGNIPRPKKSFDRMMRASTLSHASTEEMTELVMGEPLIAAKVIARVNSPLYGLRQPVVNVGQAITFLGMNSIRAICIQYMLEDSFKADSAERQAIFDDIWNSSAVSSELCFRLAQKLNIANPGIISTYTVLSFVGHIASALLLPADSAKEVYRASLAQRSLVELQNLGVSARELTRMLMEIWEMPEVLTDSVVSIDRMLLGDTLEKEPSNPDESAICYFSARLSERIVHGEATLPLSAAEIDAMKEDTLLVTPYLRGPQFAKLPKALEERDLNMAIRSMAEGLGVNK